MKLIQLEKDTNRILAYTNIEIEEIKEENNKEEIEKKEKRINFLKEKGFIETDKEVIRGYNGNLYFKGEEPQRDIKELKEIKILEVKSKASELILSKYPYYEQLNILRVGTEEEKQEMSLYIDNIRKQSNELEENIKKIKTKKTIENIDININIEVNE